MQTIMQTWFNTKDRIMALERAASEWVGTPFVANSRVKGPRGGVSCQMLAEQLYLESGAPVSFRVPSGSMKWCDVSKDSLIESFMSGKDGFQRIENATLADVLPGDVIGFKIGGCVHHIGIALGQGRFIHTMRGMGTKIFMLSDPTYASRIAKIWRPNP